ncbi:hypothetical protein ACHAXR_007640, partial [Thalassiosira sp. AJA248-18]
MASTVLMILISMSMIQRARPLRMWSGISVAQKAAPRINIGVRFARSFSTRRSSIVMMPEGPEVRTLVDQLQPAVGKRLVDFQFLSGRYVNHDRPRGFEDFAKTMTPWSNNNDGQNDDTDVVTTLSCKGKFIYLVLDQGKEMQDTERTEDYQRSIWITLGMTGQFANEEEVEKPKPVASNSDRTKSGPRWCMELMNTHTKQSNKIYYRDTRNFGTLRFCLTASELNEKLAKLGPDILDFENTTEEVFLAAMEKSTQTRNICKFLMDQGKIAGVGNYILAEGLYRSRLDPFADLSEISVGQRQRLFKELREISSTSYQAQGLTRPNGGTYQGVDGSRGQFEFQLQCYGQRLSPNKFPVTKEVKGPHGRTIWYVAEEQLFMPRSQRSQKSNTVNDGETEPSSSDDNSDDGPTYVFSDIPKQLTDPGWNRALSDHMAS